MRSLPEPVEAVNAATCRSIQKLSSDTEVWLWCGPSTRRVSGNEVRIHDPAAGEAKVISRHGKERATLIHPTDLYRLDELDRVLEGNSRLEPVAPSAQAVRAHVEEATPGEPITDPAALTELFG